VLVVEDPGRILGSGQAAGMTDWARRLRRKEPTMRESRADGSGYATRPTRRTVLSSMAGLGLAGMTGLISGSVSRMRPGAGSALALTNLHLAGQRVISSYPGLTPPQSLFNDITAGQTAGVIFFGENISSDAQIAGVITQLRQAQAQSPIQVPLLL